MSVDASSFLGRIAREAVGGQGALDALARERLEQWAEDGMPPSALCFSHLRLDCRVGLRATPRARAGAAGRLTVSPHGGTRLGVALRLLPRDQETLDDEDL
jgi:hypothetical protein